MPKQTYPIRVPANRRATEGPFAPKKPAPQNKPAPPITQAGLDRAARSQGMEAKEAKLIMRQGTGYGSYRN